MPGEHAGGDGTPVWALRPHPLAWVGYLPLVLVTVVGGEPASVLEADRELVVVERGHRIPCGAVGAGVADAGDVCAVGLGEEGVGVVRPGAGGPEIGAREVGGVRSAEFVDHQRHLVRTPGFAAALADQRVHQPTIDHVHRAQPVEVGVRRLKVVRPHMHRLGLDGIVTLTERFGRASDSGAALSESDVAVSGSGGDRGVGDLTPDREPVGHHLPVLTRRQSVSVWPEVW